MISSSQEKILDLITLTLKQRGEKVTNESIRLFISTQILHKTELSTKVRKLRSAQISEYCAKHKIKY